MTNSWRRAGFLFLNFLVVATATWAYFYRSRAVPSGYYTDAISNTINSICLSRFLRDEYGNFLPWNMRAFNDYKPAGLIYFLAAIARFVPMTLYRERLISMTIGFASLTAIFIFCRRAELIGKPRLPFALSMVWAFLLLSSWIMLPHRMGIEYIVVIGTMLALVWTTWGVLNDPDSVQWGVLNGITTGMLFHTYEGTKAFFFLQIPILIFALRLQKGSFKEVFKLRGFLVSMGVAFLFSLPIILDLLGPRNTLTRFRAVRVDGYKNPLTSLKSFVSVYWQDISPFFMFLKGDPNLRHSSGYLGLLNLFFVPLYFLGFKELYVKIFQKREIFWIYIGLIFFAAFVPVSLTHEGIPHSLRSMPAIVPLVLILLLGYAGLEKAVFTSPSKVPQVFLGIWFVFGIQQAYANFDYYHHETVKAYGDLWTYYEPYTMPAEAVATTNHSPQTINERYNRIVRQNDLNYCEHPKD